MSVAYMRRCSGKERHQTKGEANDHRSALIVSKRRVGNGQMSVYRCDQCLGWHVGRPTNAFNTRNRRRGKRANKRLRGRV